MTTPIADFVAAYAAGDTLRLHMPGHKGVGPHAAADITEIAGADSLYHADGIIAESERNAGRLFSAHTVYSAEGSSLSIRAMLCLIARYARATGRPLRILAGRNAHATLVGAVALLGLAVEWLYPAEGDAYLACTVTPGALDRRLSGMAEKPCAVYITSPDYLGHMADVAGLAAVCHRHGALLCVDNAHGAYLHFLPTPQHPLDLGADLVCDSAHKTLPCLTGAGYLHISHAAPAALAEGVKEAMALFGSTSPSYLILASLDRLNSYLGGGYREELADLLRELLPLRAALADYGYTLVGDEPLKLTLAPAALGYTGAELADYLRGVAIECEYADPDHTVLMLTPEVGRGGLLRLREALLSLPRRRPRTAVPPAFLPPRAALAPREALLLPRVTLPAAECLGRTVAAATVACPPAVPILVAGEVVAEGHLATLAYYGIETLSVLEGE